MSEGEETNRILDRAQKITVNTKEDFGLLLDALQKVDWNRTCIRSKGDDQDES